MEKMSTSSSKATLDNCQFAPSTSNSAQPTFQIPQTSAQQLFKQPASANINNQSNVLSSTSTSIIDADINNNADLSEFIQFNYYLDVSNTITKKNRQMFHCAMALNLVNLLKKKLTNFRRTLLTTRMTWSRIVMVDEKN